MGLNSFTQTGWVNLVRAHLDLFTMKFTVSSGKILFTKQIVGVCHRIAGPRLDRIILALSVQILWSPKIVSWKSVANIISRTGKYKKEGCATSEDDRWNTVGKKMEMNAFLIGFQRARWSSRNWGKLRGHHYRCWKNIQRDSSCQATTE